MDKIRALRYFKRTAELNSFSLAAKEFDVPASSISRRIKDLESELGVELIKRSTRHVSTTELGSVYYNSIVEVLLKLDEADELVSQRLGAFEGKLRISAMSDYGNKVLNPILRKFKQRYPDIVLDLDYSDSLVDFAQDPVDIAIRAGSVPQERVIAKHLSQADYKLVASPELLQKLQKQFGKSVLSSKDLGSSPTMQYRAGNGLVSWWELKDKQWQKIKLKPVLMANNGDSLIEAAMASEGLAFFPCWWLEKQLSNGELVEVPTELPMSCDIKPHLDIYILYPQAKYKIPKIKHCVDFIIEHLAGK
ncbi:MAG: LysR family transcriptional regulator [Bermanella sp.]